MVKLSLELLCFIYNLFRFKKKKSSVNRTKEHKNKNDSKRGSVKNV